MNRKLKIAVLGSTYPRFNQDPQVPWLRETVNRLSNNGHEVTVIAASHRDVREKVIDGVRVCRFRYAPKRFEMLTHDEGAANKISHPIYKLLILPYILLGTIQVLYWCVKKRFDIVNVHWPIPHHLMVILPKYLLGTKVVNTYHGAGLALARKNSKLRKFFSMQCFAAESDISNSSHTQNELKKLLNVDSKVIPYGSTVEIKYTEKKSLSDEKVILFTGRNIERKGVPYLIKALPIILKEQKSRLIITGKGDQHNTWKKLVKDMNLESKVDFVGFVSNEQLAELYNECDVYCLPAIFDSRGDTEGLGVVLIEALSYQKPVVASAVGGIVDVIQHRKTGLLVPEKNEKDLAKAILEFLKNPNYAKEVGQKGAIHAAKVFNWERVINLFEVEFYRSFTNQYSSQKRADAAVSELVESNYGEG